MQVSTILDCARDDYLADNRLINNTGDDEQLWDTDSLLRKINEAQRQACNRANLIYDDSTPRYTQIVLVAGKASYSFDQKLTVIERIILRNKLIHKKTVEELDKRIPTWRTDSGMLNKEIHATIKGRNISFTPIPDATDAGSIVYLETYRLPDNDLMLLSDEPEIPEENHRDLVYWILHEAYKKQDADTFQQEKSDYYLGRFIEIFGPYVPARVRQHQFENPKSLEFRPRHVMFNDYTSNTGVSDDDSCW